MQGRIKVLKDVDKSNILPMTHAKAVYVDEKNTLDETLNNIESQIIQQRKTYAELKELVENNKLVPGTQYVLTDYRTKYIQPTTEVLKEMEVEELILTANNKNSFETIVTSRKYPKDVIYYDFDNNVCEDTITARNGFILRRYDPITGNDAPQDWRTMLWARYKPSKTHYYKDGVLSDFLNWTGGQVGSNTYVYKIDNKLYMSKQAGVPTSTTDTSYWHEIYPDLDTPLLISEKTKWGDGIELMRGELVEVPTFGINCRGNVIKARLDNGRHNNVFHEGCVNNSLDVTSYNNTFGKNCFRNSLGKLNYGNIFSENSSNVLNNECSGNVLLKGSVNNTFSNYCTGNILLNNCYQNSFGVRCYNNILTNSCNRNSFGNGCYGNKFQSSNSYNSFGNDVYDNTFGSGCIANSFGQSCWSNSFGKDCVLNNFGNATTRSVFGDGCARNTFGNSCNGNNFGNSFINNTFFNDCDNNIFGDNFQYNVVKELKDKNLTSLGGVTRSLLTATIERGNSGYIYWHFASGNILTTTAIP